MIGSVILTSGRCPSFHHPIGHSWCYRFAVRSIAMRQCFAQSQSSSRECRCHFSPLSARVSRVMVWPLSGTRLARVPFWMANSMYRSACGIENFSLNGLHRWPCSLWRNLIELRRRNIDRGERWSFRQELQWYKDIEKKFRAELGIFAGTPGTLHKGKWKV